MPDNIISFIPAAFERNVMSVLADASIHDIDSYGWLNDNDPDPHFIGHAMWQTDRLSIDHHELLGEAPVRYRPQEIEKEILVAGEDFCGLMRASRLSIGLTLIWHRHVRCNPCRESSFFWLHHTDAFLKLAIASDRLRDFLIVASTGIFPKSYKNVSKNRLYIAPFNDARELLEERGLSDPRLSEPLASLPELATSLFAYIDRRNQIVHEVATQMARFMRASVSELQQRYDHEQQHGFSPRLDDPANSLPAAGARLDALRRDIDRAKDELRNWYMLLIRTSNSVFQVEYWSRVLGAR
ncbi:MAG: hypothetical protein H0W34_03390 [Pyrinomonadaceae bacterium]|nr:hypothetical protein [Gammaproteobacteria bacterium]MBA3571022.1 hypothetical protein [Pyrinomonadaceae bacterium]